MNRKDIYNEVEAIMDYYCKECFLYKTNRKEREEIMRIDFASQNLQSERKLSNVDKNSLVND